MRRRGPSGLRWFGLGVVAALAALGTGAYAFVDGGGVPMGTAARPLPLERAVARLALRASIGSAARATNPLRVDESNMAAGAEQYGEHCAVCHGVPGRPAAALARAMFPHPPQLFEPRGMITNDPPGVVYWKVTHGIRLSGMPAFRDALSDAQRWQLTMLLTRADQLSAAVRRALTATAR